MDSDDEKDERLAWKGVHGSIILINAFDPSSSGFVDVAHFASCYTMKQSLRTSDSNNIGVCLYGISENDSSAFGIQSVLDVIPLSAPNLEAYKKLLKFDVKACYQTKELKLSEALWHCSKVFANSKKQLSSKSVIILSRLDIPPIESDQKPTLRRIVDLVDANIEVKVINISKDDYKVNEFYEKLMIEANKGQEFIMPQPLWDIKDISKILNQHSCRHLAISNLNFEIGENVSIGVSIYSLRKITNFKKANLDSESNAIVTTINKTVKVTSEENDYSMDIDEEHNEPKQVPLLKSEVLYIQEYGGERIEFSHNEMNLMKNPFGPPLIRLLGFKPKNAVCKEKWFMKPCYFLFPNENIIEGSTVAFKALHRACYEMPVVAICILSTRVNAKPKIVALSPCNKPLNNNVDIGFDVISLPFIESVRDLVIEDEVDEDITAHEREVFKNIIKELEFDYKPDMFENPKFQSEIRAVEAIALDEDNIEPFVDTTKPSPETFLNLDEDLFNEIFGPFGAASNKRPGTSNNYGSKKPKTENIDETLLQTRLENRIVHTYTVKQLQDILKFKKTEGLPALTGLKKNQLVDLVYKYCS